MSAAADDAGSSSFRVGAWDPGTVQMPVDWFRSLRAQKFIRTAERA